MISLKKVESSHPSSITIRHAQICIVPATFIMSRLRLYLADKLLYSFWQYAVHNFDGNSFHVDCQNNKFEGGHAYLVTALVDARVPS